MRQEGRELDEPAADGVEQFIPAGFGWPGGIAWTHPDERRCLAYCGGSCRSAEKSEAARGCCFQQCPSVHVDSRLRC